MNKQLILHNEVEQISLLAVFIADIVEEVGISPELAMSLNLALEEAVTNVVLYAYPKGETGEVKIEATWNSQVITFIISDSGIPFNPTQKEDADITLDVEHRPIGGLGIFLVKQIMDSVEYKRCGDKNILTISKHINS